MSQEEREQRDGRHRQAAETGARYSSKGAYQSARRAYAQQAYPESLAAQYNALQLRSAKRMNAYENNSAFIPGTKLQFAWDSVSLNALKKCPRYYELTIVEGWQPRKKSVDLQFGIWLHSARERFYHAKQKGASHDDALCEALLWLFEETYDKELRRPWLSDHKTKNRFTLIRTFVWYCEHYKNDPLETMVLKNGKPAVELSFRFDTGYKFNGTVEETSIIYCGHIDRVARLNDVAYLNDLKSTDKQLDKKYFAQFSPNGQLTGYNFATDVVFNEEVKGIMIDACQVAVSFSRFHREPIPRSKSQLLEWHKGLGAYFAQAQDYAEADFWPMNESACWFCEFRNSVCSKPEQVRKQWLEAEFEQRVWNPLEVRGDV